VKITYSLADIDQVAKSILKELTANVVLFQGKMGVGKTTFIKALAKALNVKGTVNSPTFALINEYRTDEDKPVYHFDFYRIDNEMEALDIGVLEYFDSGAICLVEWSEKIPNLLPENTVTLTLTEKENGDREIFYK
jgi:tRNA threonylcarbamoyladenosine biosynthesis protein TsaE